MSAHKKRRVSLDQPDAYKDFSSAAAAVSSLYVQAVQAGRKGRAASLVSFGQEGREALCQLVRAAYLGASLLSTH